jgi:hypothetical protein
MSELPSAATRLRIAFGCFFRTLSDPAFAAQVDELAMRGPLPALAPAEVPPRYASPTGAPAESGGPADGALQMLSLLQREGRLLDFCEDEVANYPDATVGAAARLVHAGCRKVLRAHLELSPVRPEPEGTQVKVEPGFDPRTVRLTGNVVGDPPFQGALRHHGWRAANVRLPEGARGEAARLLAQAEIELP